METLDCVVIGAGAIGLATARALSRAGREVFVLEQHASFGQETSSHNSGVIHAGIYYPQHFLKTRLCIEGRRQLYTYCSAHNIPHQACGKLILAQDDAGIQQLRELQHKARQAGVDDLQLLDRQALKNREENIHAVAALLSPSTGIIDSHAYLLQLCADIEQQGGQIVYRHQVTGLRQYGDKLIITVNDEQQFHCRTLLNCAGHHTRAIAALLEPSITLPATYIAKGHYFSYQGRSPFQHLIYPLPEANNAGLGIHATLDLQGRLRFGPDVEYTDTLSYAADARRKSTFADAICRYFPTLEEGRLQADFAGCRPKLQGPGEPMADFMIQTEADHGIKGLINCYGIESPGLTASLAIADYIGAQL